MDECLLVYYPNSGTCSLRNSVCQFANRRNACKNRSKLQNGALRAVRSDQTRRSVVGPLLFALFFAPLEDLIASHGRH